jgi:mono/diheme cytochrome c family protein
MGNERSIVSYAMRLFVAFAAILTISSCTDKPRPRIEVAPMRCDIGHVQPLTEGRAHFDIKNTGDDHLDISEAKSECGCTASDFKPTRLKPGGTLPLDVTIDTSMKQGAVVKDMAIYSNDPEQPMVRIYIDMFVEDPHKADISEADMHAAARKIFTAESCRRCHVDEGMGLMGRDLFEADCAMCHRTQPSGITSGPLLECGHMRIDAARRAIIQKGSEKSTMMPGFSEKYGGPLTEEQIDSIVQYLNKGFASK